MTSLWKRLIEIGNSHVNHNHVIQGMEVSDIELSSLSATVHGVVVDEVSPIKGFLLWIQSDI